MKQMIFQFVENHPYMCFFSLWVVTLLVCLGIAAVIYFVCVPDKLAKSALEIEY